MTHIYIARSYGENETYKLLCTNAWEAPTEFKPNYGGYNHRGRRTKQLNFTTTRALVTCPACLDIVIPRAEAELKRMREARAKWPASDMPINEAFETTTQTEEV